jgi:hypothetical protein
MFSNLISPVISRYLAVLPLVNTSYLLIPLCFPLSPSALHGITQKILNNI